jgi:hypothetical protein
MLHGVPTWFFFHRDQRLGNRLAQPGQFQAAVAAAREKIRAGNAAKAVDATSGAQVNGTNLGKSSPD